MPHPFLATLNALDAIARADVMPARVAYLSKAAMAAAAQRAIDSDGARLDSIPHALRLAESALAQGFENCGADVDSIFAAPLAAVRAAMESPHA